APLTFTALTIPPSTIPTFSYVPQAPTPPTTAPSTFLQDLPNFGSLFGFDHRLKTLKANFSEFVQTNQFAGAVSSIPRIVERYMDQQMNKAVKVAVQLQSDRLQDEAQAENEDFINKLDENIQKIIKEQVKEQVKKPPTPDRASKKTLPATHGSIQPWISDLEKQADSRFSFNELMDTLVDFLASLMNRLKVDTLTPELQAGLTYELMKGSCKSLVELKFFLEEVYKATTDQLD
nr:hypothetical protein [Tanacetum cinerariifolium]